MNIEQIYTGCLAQGAYYITDGTEAAIIDPLREVQPYIDRARKDGVTITHIFETHFHADFVSGHLDLAKATGAKIIYGPTAKPAFDAHIATDGEIFHIGNISVKVLHTPGHTMESTCYLLMDENGKEHSVFTGDTLFIGDVGRPDLAQKAADLTQEQLASLLFHSLRNKIIPLSDEVIVYPGHGAGSACGKNMSKETVSTIGQQKIMNYALRASMTEQEFIKEVTDGLLPPPVYFPQNVAMNKNGYQSINTVLEKGLRSLSPAEFEAAANETEALVLDTRPSAEFCQGFIPNSINIGLDGQFAPWVGALIPDIQQQILLIAPVGMEEETVIRLARVGYDNVIGYLHGSFEAWKKSGYEVDTITRVTPEKFAENILDEEGFIKPDTVIIDVRKPGEFSAEHIESAISIPLDYINEHIREFPKEQHFYLHCAGGYRSVIAASILKSRGWENFTDVSGGFAQIKKTSVPKTSYVCPSTLAQK